LREVANQSEDPDVTVAALGGLLAFNDMESLPLFYTALQHPAQHVREATFQALLKLHGGALPENLEYQSDASGGERKRVSERLQEILDETRAKKN